MAVCARNLALASSLLRQVLPVQLIEASSRGVADKRPQWGMCIRFNEDICTVVLLNMEGISTKHKPTVNARSSWLDGRSFAADPRYAETADKFDNQPVGAKQDVELLRRDNKFTKSSSAYKLRRYLHHLGVAKSGADVDFKKAYADGNGTSRVWNRSSSFAHLVDTYMAICAVVELKDGIGVDKPFAKLRLDDFDFTDTPLSVALSKVLYDANTKSATRSGTTGGDEGHNVEGPEADIDDEGEDEDDFGIRADDISLVEEALHP